MPHEVGQVTSARPAAIAIANDGQMVRNQRFWWKRGKVGSHKWLVAIVAFFLRWKKEASFGTLGTR